MNDYPTNWPEIAQRIKDKAGWKCERCNHVHDAPAGYCLTVHHLDGDKANCEDWNLAALCQRCHLTIQGRIKMEQMFMEDILKVSDWFKPHLEGYLNSLKPQAPQLLGECVIQIGNEFVANPISGQGENGPVDTFVRTPHFDEAAVFVSEAAAKDFAAHHKLEAHYIPVQPDK